METRKLNSNLSLNEVWIWETSKREKCRMMTWMVAGFFSAKYSKHWFSGILSFILSYRRQPAVGAREGRTGGARASWMLQPYMTADSLHLLSTSLTGFMLSHDLLFCFLSSLPLAFALVLCVRACARACVRARAWGRERIHIIHVSCEHACKLLNLPGLWRGCWGL